MLVKRSNSIMQQMVNLKSPESKFSFYPKKWGHPKQVS